MRFLSKTPSPSVSGISGSDTHALQRRVDWVFDSTSVMNRRQSIERICHPHNPVARQYMPSQDSATSDGLSGIASFAHNT